MLLYGSVSSSYITASSRLKKMNLQIDTHSLVSLTIKNSGEYTRGILDTFDKTIPRDPISK
jgi:hypothetical protein